MNKVLVYKVHERHPITNSLKKECYQFVLKSLNSFAQAKFTILPQLTPLNNGILTLELPRSDY